MTAAYAAEVVTWRYPVPYDCYDMTDADPGFLAGPDSGFFALTDESGLIGFRSFGPDGRVPGGVYDDSALDTGGGLRPDLTGEGRGREAIQTGLDFGRQQFAPAAFRVTIATFNIRAQRVVAALGFRNIGSFRTSTDGRSYEMLIKPEPVITRLEGAVSAALGDLDGDVGGFDGGDREHSWFQAKFVGGFAAEQ